MEMRTLMSVHLLAGLQSFRGLLSEAMCPLPLGSTARAILPGRLGRMLFLGGTATRQTLLSFPCLLGSPACPPNVICQYTVIRDEARLIKIAACPEWSCPLGRV